MAGTNKVRTHPYYDEMLPLYQRNAELYAGGAAVEGSAARKYLAQHPYEKEAQYAIRLKRAAYRNLVAPTVDLFASSIHDGAKREGQDAVQGLERMLENCDTLGNTPDVFFKRLSTLAASIGAAFVLVDAPGAPESVVSLKDVKGKGLFPYFILTPAENVIAWDYDEKGALDWAALRSSRLTAEAGPFSPYAQRVTVTVWSKTGWRRFSGDKDGALAEDGEGEHGLGVVPLVPLLYEEDTPMTGRAVIDDVASLVLRVFNQDSELDKMLFDAALPILAGFGMREEDADGAYKATSNLWTFGNKEARLQYIEPSGASFAAKRQQILDDVDSIREISLRQTKPKGAQVESAEAKRMDSLQLSSQLGDFARRAAAVERRCWILAGKYLGAPDDALDAITVAYNEKFDPEGMREQLAANFLELRRNGDISRETVWRTLGMSDTSIEEEKALLENEGRARSGPEGSLGASLTALLAGGKR
jgi:hypothetical protein